MKKVSNFFKFIAIFFFSVLVFLACQKENVFQTGNSTVSNRDNGVSFDQMHNMLHFSTFKDAEDFTKSLQTQETDIQNVKNAYHQLGVDTAAEFFPNLTDHPVCLLHDQSLSFVSKRKAEEQVINAALDNGDDNIFSIVSNPYWKTILNVESAVHIGNRIYRFFDNGGIVIVLNNDWTRYNTIKNQQFDAIVSDFNVVVTSRASESWADCFVLDVNSNVLQEKAISIPRFQYVKIDVDKFSLKNLSQIESLSGSNTYLWKYSDGSTFTGLEPKREFVVNENLSVKISTGYIPDFEDPVPQVLIPCPDAFTVTKLTNNKFRFELPGFIPCSGDLKLRWSFSDGFVSGWNLNPFERIFTSNATVTCEYWTCVNVHAVCFRTKPIIVKCGDPKETFRQLTSSNWGGSGKAIRIDATLWVKNNEIGAKSNHFAKKLGIWWKLNLVYNSQGGCVDVAGSYLHGSECISKSKTQEKCLQPGASNGSITLTIPDQGLNFADPGKLSSGHRLRFLPGTWHGIGYGTPRLTLN